MQTGYYATNPLAEIAALKARIETLEKALLASRGAGRMASFSTMTADTPEAALPTADDIPALYLLEEVNGRDIYQLRCREIEGRARLYLQYIGRVREAGK